MIETAVVFDENSYPIYWHEPIGRTGGALPDSRSLWDVLWENREWIYGIAHTHPWDGPSGPSQTDITTFAAIEAGLGKRLVWPIVTMTHIAIIVWYRRTDSYEEIALPKLSKQKEWKKLIQELRQKSRGKHHE